MPDFRAAADLWNDERDPFEFVLALELHKTLGEINALPMVEYLEWQGFFDHRNATLKLEQEHAAKRG